MQYRKHIKILLQILICISIEVFIFNYGFFRTVFNESGEKSIGDYNVSIEDDKTKISIRNLNDRVTNLQILYENQPENINSYTVGYVIDGYSYITYLNPKYINPNDIPSISLDTQTTCKYIEILVNNTEIPKITNIKLNVPVMNFSILRLFILFLVLCVINILKSKKIVEIKYNKYLKKQLVISGIFLATIIALSLLYLKNQNDWVTFDDISNQQNHYEITEPAYSAEALMHNNGKVSVEPSDELKQLDNPYDPVARSKIQYIYDMAYYNESYYSYFGIAPLIVLVIPLKLITGMYFSATIYNTIFIILTIILSYFLYLKLIQKFCKKDISFVLLNLGYLGIIAGSNLLTILRGAKYDLVITSGIFFLLLSLYCILLLENKRKLILKSIIGGIATGLIVLSKPTFILYYPIIIMFMILVLNNFTKKENFKVLISFIIPLMILAIFQMYYNFIRFGSIIEFGARYQLTSFNMNINMNITFGKVLEALFKYIFTTPILDITSFPFITGQIGTLTPLLNEICYQNRVIGLISIPIVYIFLFKRNIINKKENNDGMLNTIINILFVIVILDLIITTCMGGIAENYIIDLKFILCMFAMVLWFRLLDGNNIRNKVFVYVVILTILIFLPITLSGEGRYLTNNNIELTVMLKNIFEFWS